jgi:hypothetical protein
VSGLPCPKCDKMINMRDNRLHKIGEKRWIRVRKYRTCVCGHVPDDTVESFSKTEAAPEIIKEIRNAQKALEKTEMLVKKARTIVAIS